MLISRPVLTFVRHYVEMVIAMVLGMIVLGAAFAALLGLVGVETSSSMTDPTALSLLGMAFTMTVPMVAWMRYRGHGWAPAADMTAAMFLPAFAAIALLEGGIVEDGDALMAIEHTAMFLGMLVAMLLRRDEYTGLHHAR